VFNHCQQELCGTMTPWDNKIRRSPRSESGKET